MKKWIAVLTAAMMMLSLAACGQNAGTNQESSQTQSASQEASSEASSAETTSESSATSSTSETSAASATSEASQETEPEIPIVDEDLPVSECVTLGNYKGLTGVDTYVAPDEEYIDNYITTVMTPVAVEDENAVAGNGDTANIDYEGKIDGVAFDGGTSQGYDLVLGSGTFIPGFEDGVVGMKKGETKDIEVTFPENYGSEDLAGKPAIFTVTLNEIKRTPELTDEWVAENAGVPDVTTIEEYKAYLMDYFTKNMRAQADSNLQLELWNQVIEETTVTKIPKSYYDAALANYDRLNEADAEYYNMTIDEFLEANGITKEQYNEMRETYGKDAAKNNLISTAVWEAEGLTTDGDEYKKVLEDLQEQYGMTYDELVEEFGEETIAEYGKNYTVLEKIRSYATVTTPEPTEEPTPETASEEEN